MIEYRVKETKETDKHGNITSTFIPQYKKSIDILFGISWWRTFADFVSQHPKIGAQYMPLNNEEAAWKYIRSNQNGNDTHYHSATNEQRI